MTRLLFPHPGLSVLLLVVWLLLLNSVSAGAVLTGAVISVLVPRFTAPYWPDQPKLRFGWAMMRYFGIVIWDIVLANFQVAWLILVRRNRDLRARWLVIPLEIRSPEAITTLAGTISLTPGTVSADVAADGRALLVHALDCANPEAEVARIKSRYEARLLEIFR